MEKLTGIIPALITPFTNDRVDEEKLDKVVEHLVLDSIDGLYVGGSTGEALLISVKERKQVLRRVIKQVNGRCKVIAHIGTLCTEDAVDLAEDAMEVGADAISSIPPIYYGYQKQELEQYYLDIVNAVKAPLIIYHVPALSGQPLGDDTISRLFENKNIVGIKFTAYDHFRMQRLIEKYPEKVVINGHDELYLSALSIGSECAVGSTFNFMTPKFMKLRDSFKAGDMKTAGILQGEVNKIIETMMQVGVFRAVKGMMLLTGIDAGQCKRPFLPLVPEELEKLKSVLPLL